MFPSPHEHVEIIITFVPMFQCFVGEIAKTKVDSLNSTPLETEDIFADLLR